MSLQGLEAEMSVKVSKRCTDEEVLLEPIATLQNYGNGGAKCLVKVHKGKAVFRVLNPNDKDKNIHVNKLLLQFVILTVNMYTHSMAHNLTPQASVNKISLNDSSDYDNMTFNI